MTLEVSMTCCIAALCDNRKAIVLAADKMIGLGMIESEPDIRKIHRLSKDWWLMFAGNDISPVFDVIDQAKKQLSSGKPASVNEVAGVVEKAFRGKRADLAEAMYLTPRGWTMAQFNHSGSVSVISGPMRTTIEESIQSYLFPVSLIVAGFDKNKQGHIFSLEDDYYSGNRGAARRHDIPGFHSIGSGSHGATYMMTFRKASPSVPIREMLYYVAEGKYYGEFAGGVGLRTDLYIIRPGAAHIKIKEDAVDDKLMNLCDRLQPHRLDRKAIEILNSFQGERMRTVPKLGAVPKKGKTVTVSV